MTVKIYCVIHHDPDAGLCSEWLGSEDAAHQFVEKLRAWYAEVWSPEFKLESEVGQVDFPTDRDEFVAWLNLYAGAIQEAAGQAIAQSLGNPTALDVLANALFKKAREAREHRSEEAVAHPFAAFRWVPRAGRGPIQGHE